MRDQLPDGLGHALEQRIEALFRQNVVEDVGQTAVRLDERGGRPAGASSSSRALGLSFRLPVQRVTVPAASSASARRGLSRDGAGNDPGDSEDAPCEGRCHDCARGGCARGPRHRERLPSRSGSPATGASCRSSARILDQGCRADAARGPTARERARGIPPRCRLRFRCSTFRSSGASSVSTSAHASPPDGTTAPSPPRLAACAHRLLVPGVAGVRILIEGGVPVGLFPGLDLRRPLTAAAVPSYVVRRSASYSSFSRTSGTWPPPA